MVDRLGKHKGGMRITWISDRSGGEENWATSRAREANSGLRIVG